MDVGSIRTKIEAFLREAREPALLEPGEELLPLSGDNYALEIRGTRLVLEAWDRTRNWTRRVTAIAETTPARLEITVERFARREGQMFLRIWRNAQARDGTPQRTPVFRNARSSCNGNFPNGSW